MITVLGAGGFIGSHLVEYLERSGIAHQAPARDEDLRGKPLGHVIYCIGVTGDFHARIPDMVEAHVTRLDGVVRSCSFDSLLYLSSARIYPRGTAIARESDHLTFDPASPGGFYNLTKATGEALTLALGTRGRVVRLSHVYGARHRHNLLATVLSEARDNGAVILRTALDSERDYVAVEDVVEVLVKIAEGGACQIYNIASGTQVSHAELSAALAQAAGCPVSVAPDAHSVRFAPLDITRLTGEFEWAPRALGAVLPRLVASS